MASNSSHNGSQKGVPDLSSSAVMAHLEAILDSPAFHASHRSCQFLRYVVELSLAGHPDLLKERLVGEHVFGRSADYDTGQDSIVRVKANEVRRRLAQYYDLHPEAPIRIELPAGSYTAQFHASNRALAPPAADTAAPGGPAARRWRGRRTWAAAAFVVAVAAASLALWAMRQNSPFRTFWAPFIDSQHDLVLCVPAPETYRIYGEKGKSLLLEALRPRSPEHPVPTMDTEQLRSVQIVPETGLFLGLGDARSLALLYAFVSARGKAPQIRVGDETTFTELRAGPSILIGGFTNRWTLDLLQDARFEFESENADYGIRDRSNGNFICQKPRPWEPKGNQDCAVVTRFARSKTGYPLLIAAGLDHFGTFEVGEFLTRPDLLEAALANAPAGWRDKNLQIVFRTEVVKDNVGPPKVLAAYVWE
jgi:hypothetical protein